MIDDVKSAEKSPGESEEELIKLEQTDSQKKTVKSKASTDNKSGSPIVDFSINEDGETEEKDPKKKKPSKTRRKWHPTKKEEWFTSLAFILICGVVVAFVVSHSGQKPIAHAAVIAKKVAPVQSTNGLVPSTLSGLPVSPSLNKQAVTGVMIENSDFARPQAGLSQASVVFEAIAEAGITRFLALYQDTAPTNIGPIRSVRPYYEQWALGFDASVAHVGGSPEALADIKSWNVKDLDQFYNSGAYHRISSRAAPHNMYSSIGALQQLEAKKGFTSTNFSGFPRKQANPLKTPTVNSINLTISGPDYAVHYGYNATTNSYNRSEAGAPHTDSNTNKQLSPNVVIAMVVPYSLEADKYHSDYTVIGTGQVFVFQDGNETKGTWTKTSPSSQISFKDVNGKTIALDPGQTWITAVVSPTDVSASQ
jgi:hypothetical protein